MIDAEQGKIWFFDDGGKQFAELFKISMKRSWKK
jgi:hypothetical protein